MNKQDFELNIPHPFAALIADSETECLADCCGVDAYDNTPEAIAVWIRKEGIEAARQAAAQARTLAQDVVQHGGHVSSYPLLNLYREAGPTADYLREWALNIEQAIENVASEASS